MTQPESSAPTSESEHTVSGPDAASAGETPPPAPEPWTGERVREWNAYYDIYVMLAVLFLGFAVSANKISHSMIWSQLRAGQMMAAKGVPIPLTTDTISYSMEGQRWINISWLFEWTHALLYDAASRLVPPNPNDVVSAGRRSEQVGAGALVGLTVLVRVATLLLLLGIRRSGPGLWWTAVCGTLALGAIYSPLGIMLGGIGGPAAVAPETWGQLFLALELLLLHRTLNLGQPRAVFGLVPLFLLWANVSDSFLIGLLILAASVLGRQIQKPRSTAEPDPLPFSRGLSLLGASAAICLLNPSWHRAYLAALEPFIQLFQASGSVISSEQLSYFGKEIRGRSTDGSNNLWVYLIAYYCLIVLAGLASFVVNRKRFSLGRFLTFVVAALLWALYIRFGVYFAIVFAAVLSLNGQEWYQDRFGTEGRLGWSWSLFSTGGRFVTILVVFLLVAKCLTGYGRMPGENVFGFGFNPDDFAFEAADYLRTAKIQGRILNTTRLQGDSLAWKAFPLQRPYIDGRDHLFTREVQEELHKIRLALADDDVKVWKPLLDQHQISVVMIEPSSAPRTLRKLMKSAHWVPFYDDGAVVMFGRADAPASDLAWFQANRLDPESLVYRSEKPLPPFDRPPTPVGRLDEIFQGRFGVYAQPHTRSAQRWLLGTDSQDENGNELANPPLPDPARCILAIREARIALSRKPDDSQAYRILSRAYHDLMILESAILLGVQPTPENRDTITQVPVQTQLLMNRFRQRVTALNFAIQTSPPPRSPEERQTLFQLNFELYQLYMSVNFRDLARDRLQAALANATQEVPAFRSQMNQEFGLLDDEIKQLQDNLSEMVAEQQTSPLARADIALRNGAPGLAIQEYEEALQLNVAVSAVKPNLVDLYCDTGQPEKALDIVTSSTAIDDPTLGTEPGMAAFRQGRVYWLLGHYTYASSLWKNYSIPQIRHERSFSAIGAALALLHGDGKQAASTFVGLPTKLSTQATWLNERALCDLESGESSVAAESFTQALTLAPQLPTRRVSAYYLEKLGKPVPPVPEKSAESTTKAKGTADKPKAEDADKPKAEESPKPKAEDAEKPKAKAEEAPKSKSEDADKPKAKEAPEEESKEAESPK